MICCSPRSARVSDEMVGLFRQSVDGRASPQGRRHRCFGPLALKVDAGGRKTTWGQGRAREGATRAGFPTGNQCFSCPRRWRMAGLSPVPHRRTSTCSSMDAQTCKRRVSPEGARRTENRHAPPAPMMSPLLCSTIISRQISNNTFGVSVSVPLFLLPFDGDQEGGWRSPRQKRICSASARSRLPTSAQPLGSRIGPGACAPYGSLLKEAQRVRRRVRIQTRRSRSPICWMHVVCDALDAIAAQADYAKALAAWKRQPLHVPEW